MTWVPFIWGYIAAASFRAGTSGQGYPSSSSELKKGQWRSTPAGCGAMCVLSHYAPCANIDYVLGTVLSSHMDLLIEYAPIV